MIEMIEAAEEFGIRKITDLANGIYECGYLPNDIRESVFVAIPKNPVGVPNTELLAL